MGIQCINTGKTGGLSPLKTCLLLPLRDSFDNRSFFILLCLFDGYEPSGTSIATHLKGRAFALSHVSPPRCKHRQTRSAPVSTLCAPPITRQVAQAKHLINIWVKAVFSRVSI